MSKTVGGNLGPNSEEERNHKISGICVFTGTGSIPSSQGTGGKLGNLI